MDTQRCPESEFALHKAPNSYERYSCDFLLSCSEIDKHW